MDLQNPIFVQMDSNGKYQNIEAKYGLNGFHHTLFKNEIFAQLFYEKVA